MRAGSGGASGSRGSGMLQRMERAAAQRRAARRQRHVVTINSSSSEDDDEMSVVSVREFGGAQGRQARAKASVDVFDDEVQEIRTGVTRQRIRRHGGGAGELDFDTDTRALQPQRVGERRPLSLARPGRSLDRLRASDAGPSRSPRRSAAGRPLRRAAANRVPIVFSDDEDDGGALRDDESDDVFVGPRPQSRRRVIDDESSEDSEDEEDMIAAWMPVRRRRAEIRIVHSSSDEEGPLASEFIRESQRSLETFRARRAAQMAPSTSRGGWMTSRAGRSQQESSGQHQHKVHEASTSQVTQSRQNGSSPQAPGSQRSPQSVFRGRITVPRTNDPETLRRLREVQLAFGGQIFDTDGNPLDLF